MHITLSGLKPPATPETPHGLLREPTFLTLHRVFVLLPLLASQLHRSRIDHHLDFHHPHSTTTSPDTVADSDSLLTLTYSPEQQISRLPSADGDEHKQHDADVANRSPGSGHSALDWLHSFVLG